MDNANAQQGWVSQSSGTSVDLFGVCFVDSNHGLAVGVYGTILLTTNGGSNWTVQAVDSATNLHGVAFVDPNTAIAVGYNFNRMQSEIRRSTNGGVSWMRDSTNAGYFSGAYLRDVCVTGGNIVVAAGYGGTVVRSVSGGGWTSISPSVNIQLEGVYFHNMTSGFAVGWEGWILRTTDEGTTWQSTSTGGGHRYNDLSFGDANNGTAVGFTSAGFGIIARTTNGGGTWTTQGIANMLGEVSFPASDTGTAVGANGTILRTTNRGMTWTSQVSGSSQGLLGVHFIHPNVGTAVGVNGTILRTTTGGVVAVELNWESGIPSIFELHQNYPNPFNPSTTLSFDIPYSSFVILKVYDILGREVATLVAEERPAGTYRVRWDASALSSGVYFYSLVALQSDGGQTSAVTQTRKLILLR